MVKIQWNLILKIKWTRTIGKWKIIHPPAKWIFYKISFFNNIFFLNFKITISTIFNRFRIEFLPIYIVWILNMELMHECCPQHLHVERTRMKWEKRQKWASNEESMWKWPKWTINKEVTKAYLSTKSLPN